MASSPSLAEQDQIVSDAVGSPLVAGDVHYALSNAWLARWKAHVKGEGPAPGEIDSSDLAEEKRELYLRKGIVDGVDYSLIPAPAYKQLVSWYGVAGPEFPRTVISQSDGSTRVELFPQYCVFTAEPKAGRHVALLSRYCGVPDVLAALFADEDARNLLGLSAVDRSAVRMWSKPPRMDPSPIESGNSKSNSSSQNGGGGGGDDVVDSSGTIVIDDSPSISAAPADDEVWMPFLQPTTVDEVAANEPESHFLVEIRRDDGSWTRGEIPFETHAPPHTGPADDLAWRKGLKVGSLLDARDSYGTWCEAVVVSLPPPRPSPPGAPRTPDALTQRMLEEPLKIHFFGWTRDEKGKEFDEVIARGGTGPVDKNDLSAGSTIRLKPLHSETSKWRYGLRPGDRVEVSSRAITEPLAAAVAAAAAAAARSKSTKAGGKKAAASSSSAHEHPSNWYVGVVTSLDFTQHPPLLSVAFPANAWGPEGIPIHFRDKGLDAAELLGPVAEGSDGADSSTGGGSARPYDATVPVFGNDYISKLGSHIHTNQVGTRAALPYPPPEVLGYALPPLPPQRAYTERGMSSALDALYSALQSSSSSSSAASSQSSSASSVDLGAAAPGQGSLGFPANAVPAFSPVSHPLPNGSPTARYGQGGSIGGGVGGSRGAKLQAAAVGGKLGPVAAAAGGGSPPYRPSSSSSSSSSAAAVASSLAARHYNAPPPLPVRHSRHGHYTRSGGYTSDDDGDDDVSAGDVSPASALVLHVRRQREMFQTALAYYFNGYAHSKYKGAPGAVVSAIPLGSLTCREAECSMSLSFGLSPFLTLPDRPLGIVCYVCFFFPFCYLLLQGLNNLGNTCYMNSMLQVRTQ